MTYPTISDYIDALRSAEDNLDALSHLRLCLDEQQQPIISSGNFAVVLKMKDPSTQQCYALKCFLRDQPERNAAYRHIARELEYISSPYLIPLRYLEGELFVDVSGGEASEYPVVLMDWVEGQPLDRFVDAHLDDGYALAQLSYRFAQLCMWLRGQSLAHGDLKPDNILVRPDGTLTLVDYDGMFVPDMEGQALREVGSPHYRHPLRSEQPFNEHLDDYALALLALSLQAIALSPTLRREWGTADCLLFSEQQQHQLTDSPLFERLLPLLENATL